MYNASSKALFREVLISPSINIALPVASTCLKLERLSATNGPELIKKKANIKEALIRIKFLKLKNIF
jgi:hypothetical protein